MNNFVEQRGDIEKPRHSYYVPQDDGNGNYLEAQLNWKRLVECVQTKDPVMFQVYKRIGWYDAFKRKNAKNFDDMFKPDEMLFSEMKNIIRKLVLVDPAERLKLKDVRPKLKALDKNLIDDFLLLKE